MNKELFQAQQSDYEHQQDNKQQDTVQNQNLEFIFKNDQSLKLNLPQDQAQISNDQKYLVIVRANKIQVYYFKNIKLLKKIQFVDNHVDNQRILIINFSNNSRLLLFGDAYGCLGCYDIYKNYKSIYFQKVHYAGICDVISLDDDQILTGSNRSLIITNIKYNQQLLKIDTVHVIKGIEFAKSKDFIISFSTDKSIKFFNRKDGKLQIEKKKISSDLVCRPYLIQLISNNNNLISTTPMQLRLWLIDYKKLRLIKLKEFNNIIYNFRSNFNNNYIVVICDECVLILDKNLVVIQSINLKFNQNSIIYYQIGITNTRQLDSLNYILVQYKGQFLILKKFGKLQK